MEYYCQKERVFHEMPHGIVEFADGLIERLRAPEHGAEGPYMKEQKEDKRYTGNPVQGKRNDLGTRIPPDFTYYLTKFCHGPSR